MDELSNQESAVELLQQLGLKEYEAKAFVALSRLPHATAKEISKISEVPRTRVYDAIRVLETKGLVEIQHSNPQKFRAVPIEEAVETVREEYESRAEALCEALQELESQPVQEETETIHEVWSLAGEIAIRNRTAQLVDEAERELVLVVGQETVLTDRLLDRLRAAQQRRVTILVGTTTDDVRTFVQTELPDAEVFVSGLEWLGGPSSVRDETEINRIVLLDRNTILVSTVGANGENGGAHEHAVFGRGFDNGFVAIARRLMATGLASGDDPGVPEM